MIDEIEISPYVTGSSAVGPTRFWSPLGVFQAGVCSARIREGRLKPAQAGTRKKASSEAQSSSRAVIPGGASI